MVVPAADAGAAPSANGSGRGGGVGAVDDGKAEAHVSVPRASGGMSGVVPADELKAAASQLDPQVELSVRHLAVPSSACIV